MDKTYEEVEIEIPAPVFKKLEGREARGIGDLLRPLARGARVSSHGLPKECDFSFDCNSIGIYVHLQLSLYG